MAKYILKHKNMEHLEETNAFLKYYTDINFKHIVFEMKEATQFESKKRVEQMRNKFKHPEYWEVIKIRSDVK